MRFWFDTEFIEDGKTIDLLSIGIVAEDGREFYAENASADLDKANPWVREHVLPQLWSQQADKRAANLWSRDGGSGALLRHEQIGPAILQFVRDRPHDLTIGDQAYWLKPEFWGYYADYDWVALCQLFGTMMDLPKGWPMYCRDIKQWADMLGNPRLPEQGKGEHHALADARWNRQAWEFLREAADGR